MGVAIVELHFGYKLDSVLSQGSVGAVTREI